MGERFYARFRGVVHNHRDPQGRGRLQVLVPDVPVRRVCRRCRVCRSRALTRQRNSRMRVDRSTHYRAYDLRFRTGSGEVCPTTSWCQRNAAFASVLAPRMHGDRASPGAGSGHSWDAAVERASPVRPVRHEGSGVCADADPIARRSYRCASASRSARWKPASSRSRSGWVARSAVLRRAISRSHPSRGQLIGPQAMRAPLSPVSRVAWSGPPGA